MKKEKKQSYVVDADVLWQGGARQPKGARLELTPSEAKWLLAQGKIKPVTAKRKRRAAPKSEPKGEE